MNYPIDKYQFHIATKVDGTPYKVIAVSTYAGKKVRGIAKCDSRDTFSLESGKKLAAARCAVKVAEKRVKRAEAKVREADRQWMKADAHVRNMEDYLENAQSQFWDAQDEVASLLAEL